MTLLMLLMLVSGLSMATVQIVLDDDAIEKRSLFGTKRLLLSEISCRCHYYTRAGLIVNLYANNTPLRMFRSDMRVPIGLFSLKAGEQILEFMEPIPENDRCSHWRNVT